VLDFDEISAGECAGRPTVRVHALPRAAAEGHDDAALWRLGAMGADELHLDVDAERGTLLRAEARFEGRPFAISELLEITFDEQFPDDTFEFTPPPGEEIRSIAEQFPIRRNLTIEQTVALAPFTVWIAAHHRIARRRSQTHRGRRTGRPVALADLAAGLVRAPTEPPRFSA
jgi:hypothetical protein